MLHLYFNRDLDTDDDIDIDFHPVDEPVRTMDGLVPWSEIGVEFEISIEFIFEFVVVVDSELCVLFPDLVAEDDLRAVREGILRGRHRFSWNDCIPVRLPA
jgi:hypothetical protein